METELRVGDVFACKGPGCPIEVAVQKGGPCHGLACCGQEMVRIFSEEDALQRYEEDMRGKCEQDGG